MATVTLTKHQPAYDDVRTGSGAGVSTWTLQCPAGAAVGDTLLLVMSIRADRTWDTATSDLLLFDQIADEVDGTDERLGVWTRPVESGDLGHTWTFGCDGGTTAWAGSLTNYTNVAAVADSAFDAGDDTLPAFAVNGAELADHKALAVAIQGHKGASAITFTPPSGFTERADVCNGSGTLRVAVGVSDYVPVFGDVDAVWQGSATGGAAGKVVGWVLFYGVTDIAITDLPTNPNETAALTIPFLDGTHTLYRGWSGGLLLAEANIGGSGFRLSDPDFGRLSVGRLGPADDGWVTLGDIEEITGVFGCSEDAGVLSRSEAGTCQIVLNDWDGVWDPMNIDSPYHQDWHLGCRVRIGWNAVEQLDVIDPSESAVTDIMFMVFNGRVEDMVASGLADEDPIVTIQCVDDIAILAASDPLEQAAVGSGDTLDERVARILANVGDPVDLDFAVGHPEWPAYTYQSTTMAQPAWSEILLACDAALVAPIMRGAGYLYLTPQAPDTANYHAYGFDGSADEGLVDVELAYNRSQLRNVINYARVGGSEVTVADTSSITRNGGRFEYTRDDLPLADDADVADVAARTLVRSSDPTPRVTSIGFWPQVFGVSLYHDDAFWTGGTLFSTVSVPVYFTLGRLIEQRQAATDMIEVTFQHPMTGREQTQLVMVRGCQLRITAEEWQVRFVTASVDSWFDVFTLSDPEQGRLSRGHRLAAA